MMLKTGKKIGMKKAGMNKNGNEMRIKAAFRICNFSF